MLTQAIKKFEIDSEEYDDVLTVYGDNILESVDIIEQFCQFNKKTIQKVELHFVSISTQAYVVKMLKPDVTLCFLAKAYFHNGEVHRTIRRVITTLDKPDAIVYSARQNKIVMGFESTKTTMAGNATWQRSGRIISFAKEGIPFAFLAYHSKIDQSNSGDGTRKPSALFVLFFIAVSLKFSVPSLVGLYEHPDSAHWNNRLKPATDFRKAIFLYLKDCILTNGNKENLQMCYANMREYYCGHDAVVNIAEEFGGVFSEYIKNNDFAKTIVKDISSQQKRPLFSGLFFKWKPKIISDIIQRMFPNVVFFQLSKHCKAGITFQSKKLFDCLQEGQSTYVVDRFSSSDRPDPEGQPTIIIPIKMTKMQQGEMKFTDDPYNGEIPGFTELYKQSYPNANVLLILTDHSNRDEYRVEDRKGAKTYKAINMYADALIDIDKNFFSVQCENTTVDRISRYDSSHTEDEATSFFATFLKAHQINLSFINPPDGSWSDFRLYPEKGYYYYKRNDKRGDIAFYNCNTKVYYFIESKDLYSTLKSCANVEHNNLKSMAKKISDQLHNHYQQKFGALFYGTADEASNIVINEKFDLAIALEEDTDNILIHVCGANNEIPWK